MVCSMEEFEAGFRCFYPWKDENFNGVRTRYWVNGIYKVVTDDDVYYYAYFINHDQKNWGDHVCVPPLQRRIASSPWPQGYWPSLESAMRSAYDHLCRNEATPEQLAVAAKQLTILEQKAEEVAWRK